MALVPPPVLDAVYVQPEDAAAVRALHCLVPAELELELPEGKKRVTRMTNCRAVRVGARWMRCVCKSAPCMHIVADSTAGG